MSKVTEKELKAYFSDISKAIVCDRKKKKEFLGQLKNDVETYLAENGEATISQIEACFGSSESIAASFMENIGAERLKKSIDIRRAVIIALAAALVIYALFVVISLVDVHQEAHGYIEEGIMMIKNVTGGEFK